MFNAPKAVIVASVEALAEDKPVLSKNTIYLPFGVNTVLFAPMVVVLESVRVSAPVVRLREYLQRPLNPNSAVRTTNELSSGMRMLAATIPGAVAEFSSPKLQSEIDLQ